MSLCRHTWLPSEESAPAARSFSASFAVIPSVRGVLAVDDGSRRRARRGAPAGATRRRAGPAGRTRLREKESAARCRSTVWPASSRRARGERAARCRACNARVPACSTDDRSMSRPTLVRPADTFEPTVNAGSGRRFVRYRPRRDRRTAGCRCTHRRRGRSRPDPRSRSRSRPPVRTRPSARGRRCRARRSADRHRRRAGSSECLSRRPKSRCTTRPRRPAFAWLPKDGRGSAVEPDAW